MLHPLPMQFRAPFPDEALPGYLSECAERYSAHPGALLELADCPTSLRRSAFLTEVQADHLARLLGQAPEDVTSLVYPKAPNARGIPRVEFHGAVLRRAHLVARKRRISPATMRDGNYVRALSAVQAITFCPESWTLLTEHCLNPACGKPLSWQKLDHVSRCPACECDQRDFETAPVPLALRPCLKAWADLVHPLADRQSAALVPYHEKLKALGSGSIFDLVLGLASVLGPSGEADHEVALEAIARATEVVLNWPERMLAELEADAATADARQQSLSTRLRRYAQAPTTLPEVRALLLYDLARDRSCPLGVKAEIVSARRKVGGMGVREAAVHIGVAPPYVTALRRAGILQAKTITRGRVRLELLTYQSCESARADLQDRMSEAEFAHLTGFSEHAIAQLLSAGHIEQLRAPAIDALFDRPMLRRSSAEFFVERLRSRVFPLGKDDADWIPLQKAFVAVGGRPKPYGSFLTWMYDQGAHLLAPVDADGAPDLRALHVSPLVVDHLSRFESEFSAVESGEAVSSATAGEILNCDTADLQILIDRKQLASCPDRDGFVPVQSVAQVARQLISFGEINARLGGRERGVRQWLRARRIIPAFDGFADRPTVEKRLGVKLPYGLVRRHLLGLTVKRVMRGGADLTDREWELARAWIPRQRRSRRGVCDRSVLNAAIWVSATGRRWNDIPAQYGDPSANYSRYHHWKCTGTLDTVYRILAREHRRNLDRSRAGPRPSRVHGDMAHG
jgi:transposase